MRMILSTGILAALMCAADNEPTGAAQAGGPGGAAVPFTPTTPARPETNEEIEARVKRQGAAAARTLREQADRAARNFADHTGTPLGADKVPTEEEAGNLTQEFTRGPNPATEFRPGETASGPVRGRAAIGAPRLEHQTNTVGMIPTINAPGVGADSGIKKTADNPDARGGEGHANGPDPADNVRTPEVPFPNADATPVHSEERNDTVEQQAEFAAKRAKEDAQERKAVTESVETAKPEPPDAAQV